MGTGKAIKLPFVIGTPEYDRHPYAGIIFTGTDVEQVDHFQNEQEQLKEDKANE